MISPEVALGVVRAFWPSDARPRTRRCEFTRGFTRSLSEFWLWFGTSPFGAFTVSGAGPLGRFELRLNLV